MSQFSAFPPNWKLMELRQLPISIIDGDRGKNYPTKSEFSPEGYCLFLNTGNIQNDRFDFTKCEFVTEQKDSLLRKGKLVRGDLVLTTRGTVGDIGYFHRGVPLDHVRINSGMVILRCNDELSSHYLYQLLKSRILKVQFQLFSSGSAQPQLPIKDLRRVKLPIPGPATQQKIAAILSAYDELIENNKRRIALLEKMAEEIYREWFVRLRFPGYERVKFVKGIPSGWSDVKSNKVFKVMSGGTPSTENLAYWDGGIPFFTPKDGGDIFYVLKTERTLTQNGLESCSSQLFEKNTIFITARGTVGKVYLSYRGMAMNQTCYALAPIDGGEVYFHFLTIKNAITYIKGISKSGVFDNIIVDTFKIVPILLPPAPLIAEFNDYASPVFAQIGALLESNEVLAKTRDLLLPRLISGKLSVENLDIQFPPGLLEEMKSEPPISPLRMKGGQKGVGKTNGGQKGVGKTNGGQKGVGKTNGGQKGVGKTNGGQKGVGKS